MKRFILTLPILLCLICNDTLAAGKVALGYDLGAEVVSAYLWRGQYNGGLSFQPMATIGFDTENTSFRIGTWASIGASDWAFKSNLPIGEENPNTYFVPEVDLMLSYNFYGITIGANHYYYCDGSNFFSWKPTQTFLEDENSSQTEVFVGYSFDHSLGQAAYINWYTFVAGNDFLYNEETLELERAWSSYLEMGYDYSFDFGLTIGVQLGFSLWESEIYGNEDFALTNLSARIGQEWEFDLCSIELFAQGMLNTCDITKDNLFVKEAGDNKIGIQKLNGTIGLGIWF